MKTWKISDIGVLLKNSFTAIMKGEFLLRLNVGKYFIHIIYTFLLFALIIWVSLMVETTMAKVESQKAQIRELKIINSQKVYELAETTRRSEVDKRLESLGSQVGEREERAAHVFAEEAERHPVRTEPPAEGCRSAEQ